MSNYQVEFEYLLPEFSTAELVADDEESAIEKAKAEFLDSYPEVTELTVISVTKTD